MIISLRDRSRAVAMWLGAFAVLTMLLSCDIPGNPSPSVPEPRQQVPIQPPPQPESPSESGNTGGILGLPQEGAAPLETAGTPITLPCDRRPRCVDVNPISGPRGTLFQINMAKYPAGQSFQLDFYRAVACPPLPGNTGISGRACYIPVTSVQTAPTNSRGETHYNLQTYEGDVVGFYLVQVVEDPSEGAYRAYFSIEN